MQASTVLELAASLVGVALGTALPLGTIANLAAQLVVPGWSSDAPAEHRLSVAVDGWVASHRELVEPIGGGLLKNWERRLSGAFNEAGLANLVGCDPQARATAVRVLAQALFVAPNEPGWPAACEACEALLEDLPELVVAAAGEGELKALLILLRTDLKEILGAVGAISDRLPARVAQEVAVETYLAALRTTLDDDRWARLLGGGDQTLQSRYVARQVRGQGTEEWKDVDEMAAACERLVVLGDPGLGKSWLARRLAMRAADIAIAKNGAELPELPLFASASSVLDAPADRSPWNALMAASVGGLGDLIGSGAVAALTDLLDRADGRYLVVLDGLDEAVRAADATGLERLTRARSRQVRIVLTSRPGAWRGQLEIDAHRLPQLGARAAGAHAVAELRPLYDSEVRELVAELLRADPDTAQRLVERLDGDEQLSRLAINPLACVMLCVAVQLTGEVPRSRARLFASVITLLLRSTWRRELPEQATLDARRILQDMACNSSALSTSGSAETWSPLVLLPVGREIGREVLECIDSVAPIASFDPLASAQARRFVHESVRAQLLAESIAAMAKDSACELLRDRLWFDVNWGEVLAAAIALHPARSKVLRELLEVDAEGSLDWSDVTRMDGFGELRRLLRQLARETEANAWEPDCRAVITHAAHEELAEQPYDALRLELIRGGWPDDRSREEHLVALREGDPQWPDRDIPAAVVSLELGDQERHEIAELLAEGSAIVDSHSMARAALTLDALCADVCARERHDPRKTAAERVTQATETGLFLFTARALDVLRPTSEQRLRIAATLVQALEQVDAESPFAANMTARLGSRLSETTDDTQLLRRAGERVLDVFCATLEPSELAHLLPTAPLLSRDVDLSVAAVSHVLHATENIGSYDTRRLLELIEELAPPVARAGAMLSMLLQAEPSVWPRLGVMLDAVERLARGVQPADVDELTGVLVDRLESAELVELEPLVRTVERLGMSPPRRAKASALLLERLRAAPPQVILSCALALRRVVDAESAGAAAEVLATHLQAQTDPAMRFAMATGVLWFAELEPVRRRAVDTAVELIDVGGIFGFQEVRTWAASEFASSKERGRIFDAMLGMLSREPTVPTSIIARELLGVPVDATRRATAITVLLDRLRADPGTHPYDWMLPAARLGASTKQIEQANDLVVSALATIELQSGVLAGLSGLWGELPLTDSQLDTAAGHVVDRLTTLEGHSVELACFLLDELQAADELRRVAIGDLRARLGVDSYEDIFLLSGIRTLDPTFVPQTNEDDLLADLRELFSLDAAEQLASTEPSDATRKELTSLFLEWVLAEQQLYFWDLDRIEQLGDNLRLEPKDLERVPHQSGLPSEAVRRLAASARRRCSGEEWRAFLRSAAAP